MWDLGRHINYSKDFKLLNEYLNQFKGAILVFYL